jgi:nucleotide-binding universal stress UspA family protein
MAVKGPGGVGCEHSLRQSLKAASGRRELAMSIKTILVHIADANRMKQIFGTALMIPCDPETALVGLYVIPPTIFVGAGMPGDPAPLVFDVVRKQFQSQADSVRLAFENQVTASNRRPVWCQVDAEATSVLTTLLAYARTADLVVAGQADPGWPYSEDLEFPDSLALESGRPVLLVPYSQNSTSLGQRVLVAWDGRREAVRAVFDALPILRRATAVHVVFAKADDDLFTDDYVSSRDICTALARHGVACDAGIAKKGGHGTGRVLLTEAREFSADLLVMGCYGHSRFREFILGGATRHVLSQMHLPVLMSH